MTDTGTTPIAEDGEVCLLCGEDCTCETPSDWQVFVGYYECPECGSQIELADYETGHRTHIGYEAAGVRCGRCDVAMVRIRETAKYRIEEDGNE